MSGREKNVCTDITFSVLVSLNVLTVMLVSASDENNNSILRGPYSTV